jgi:hypothetical protein
MVENFFEILVTEVAYVEIMFMTKQIENLAFAVF